MSLRLSSSQSAHFVSLWGGLGIPGSEVPLTGDNGGSPLANDGISPTSEYRIETVTQPSVGTLTVYPDTSYEFSGAADGTYPWVYRVFEDSIDRGTATEYLVVGSPVASFAASTVLPTFAGSASVAGVSPEASFAVATALPSFVGSAQVSPVAGFTVATALPSFFGSASVAGVSPIAQFNAATALPAFVGAVSVSPVASFSAVTALPIFSGAAASDNSPATFSFAVQASLPVFAGGAQVSPVAVFSVQTPAPIFYGSAGEPMLLSASPAWTVKAAPRAFSTDGTRNFRTTGTRQ